MSFLPPNTLPRLTNSPYDDPKVFADTWDETMALIEGADGASGSGGLNDAWFFKTGRMITSPLPTIAGSPALGIWLPEGFQWMQDGVAITLDEGVLVGDLEANFDGYAVIKATDDGAGGWDWEVTSTNEDKSTFAGGAGVIGHVVTDSDGLVSIETEPIDADVIYDMPSIVSILAGVSGGSGSVLTMLSQLIYNSADPRNAVTVIEEKLAANLAAALAAAESGGVVPSTTETDQIWTWLLAFRNILGVQAPNLLRLQLGAGARPGLHGTSSAPETIQYDAGGTLPAIPEEREYDSR